MKIKCAICGKEYNAYEMFCLNSCRGATSKCKEQGCVVVCYPCLFNLYKCLVHVFKRDDEKK